MEDREFLLFALLLNCLTVPSCPPNGHGYYYKNGVEKCNGQAFFTEGIGLHDGTGRKVELR